MPRQSIDSFLKQPTNKETAQRVSPLRFPNETGQANYFTDPTKPTAAYEIIFGVKRGLDQRILAVRAAASAIVYPDEIATTLTPRIRAAVLAESFSQVFPPSVLEKRTGITAANLAKHKEALAAAPEAVRNAPSVISRQALLAEAEAKGSSVPAYKHLPKKIFINSEQQAQHARETARKKTSRRSRNAAKPEQMPSIRDDSTQPEQVSQPVGTSRRGTNPSEKTQSERLLQEVLAQIATKTEEVTLQS